MYEGVVIELRVPPFGTTADPALNKVLVAKNYTKYVEEGGKLNLDEYTDLILLDEDLTATTYSGSLGYILTESRVVVGDYVGVTLKFSAPNLDPIGESKVWFRWIFFNDEDTCS